MYIIENLEKHNGQEFKFVELNKTLLPTQTKGKNQNGIRFYEIDGKSYHQLLQFYLSENQKD